MPATQQTKPSHHQPRVRPRLTWIPIRHPELPPDTDMDRQGPDLAWTAGAVAGLIAGGVAWSVTGSLTLAVFWLAVAADAARILVAARSGDGLARHVGVVLVAGAVALGTLLLALSLWGPAWYAVAFALVCGAAARGLAAWIIAPSLVGNP